MKKSEKLQIVDVRVVQTLMKAGRHELFCQNVLIHVLNDVVLMKQLIRSKHIK